ncbi:hypothetical protein GGX14DRAFT_648583 [Mycena pura]|uniref:Fatty acid desaturase domain-containing protein n=1 Tax=Mycena pura TaxID=153505 RepID=A0AAD7E1P0_9AGAR|nr:hypothetical protein GGX14DRAFT_648583 [Mycena pura]
MPPSVFEHRIMISILVLGRDIILAIALAYVMSVCKHWTTGVLQAMVWAAYWWFQGLVFTGIWVVGHECAHGSFLPSGFACNVIGLVCHSFLWTPYFSWKYVHHIHHRQHGLMDEDQHWIPKTRSELATAEGHASIWHYLEDTPVVALVKLIVQQIIGFPLYLLVHVTGPRHYPTFTSHFNPFSIFYAPRHRFGVILSDICLAFMAYGLSRATSRWGNWNIFLFYGVPCLLVSHWVTMIVYLHHNDKRVPHYRLPAWTYTRGAMATIDRDFLGWQGRFFLHDFTIFSRGYHFVRLRDQSWAFVFDLADLNTCDDPVFKSLWENYRNCRFVEDDGNILFYKDKDGRFFAPDS